MKKYTGKIVLASHTMRFTFALNTGSPFQLVQFSRQMPLKETSIIINTILLTDFNGLLMDLMEKKVYSWLCTMFYI